MLIPKPFPWFALIGDGCPDSKTMFASVYFKSFYAKLPHSKKHNLFPTIWIFWITASVKNSILNVYDY
jgi:hypothetical protein